VVLQTPSVARILLQHPTSFYIPYTFAITSITVYYASTILLLSANITLTSAIRAIVVHFPILVVISKADSYTDRNNSNFTFVILAPVAINYAAHFAASFEAFSEGLFKVNC
jgi:hypothetical protein